MPDEVTPPHYDDVVTDLKTLREKGLLRLRTVRLPALQAAALLAGETDQTAHEPAAIEALLRRAVEQLGGDTMGEAAEYLFGLVRGTIGWRTKDLRERAASFYHLTPDTFRKEPERLIVGQVAEEILKRCHAQRMRQEHAQLERRSPADSRLAVQWIERFEAYYRIWTPAGQLADDLRAASSTRREGDAGLLVAGAVPSSYNAEDQAEGYARFALYAYTSFLLELRRFMARHGGLWLLSDAEAEQQVADAVYRISWHTPFNEEDDSWLRRTLSDVPHEEQASFTERITTSPIGQERHTEWQQFVAACGCPSEGDALDECQVHKTIYACDDYCRIVDEDWMRIADWYHPGVRRPPALDGGVLYKQRTVKDHQQSK